MTDTTMSDAVRRAIRGDPEIMTAGAHGVWTFHRIGPDGLPGPLRTVHAISTGYRCDCPVWGRNARLTGSGDCIHAMRVEESET